MRPPFHLASSGSWGGWFLRLSHLGVKGMRPLVDTCSSPVLVLLLDEAPGGCRPRGFDMKSIVGVAGRHAGEDAPMPTPVTALLLRQIRSEQGRMLHQPRCLWLVPDPIKEGSRG